MGTTLADCGQAERELLARLATPSRNRYYYGKLLDAYHLELEQRYGNDKRWLLNRLTLGTGVLCGLDVVASNDNTRVRVTGGVAVDGVGREIVVPEPSIGIDPRQPTDECGRADGAPITGNDVVTLYLCYLECEAEPAPALVSECGCEPGCEHGLVRERYRLTIRRGEPPTPGQITPEQCAAIFGQPPGNTPRRQIVCQTLGNACDAPDETCVPLARIALGDGGVPSIERCVGRRTIYSNAILFDMILCLAARVDQCCGGGQTTVKSIAVVSGDGQSTPAGQQVPQPLVVRVLDGATPVPNETVTFDALPFVAPNNITPGGIGDDPNALGGTFTATTDANGVATLPIWKLAGFATSQQVKASIATGAPSSVTFTAQATKVDVTLPVVRAIWPPNAVHLARQVDDPVVSNWARAMAESPHIEVTFDRAMNGAELDKTDGWLRVFVLHDVVNQQVSVRRVAITRTGTVAQPQSGISGVTEGYALRGISLDAGDLKDARWLVLMRAENGNIVDLSTSSLLLDADYVGTKLTDEDRDAIWQVGEQVMFGIGLWSAFVNTGAVLPQSGNGTEGGQFNSWFEVEGVG